MQLSDLNLPPDFCDTLIPADIAVLAALSRDPLQTLAQNLVLDARIGNNKGQLHAFIIFKAAGYDSTEANQCVQLIIRESWSDI